MSLIEKVLAAESHISAATYRFIDFVQTFADPNLKPQVVKRLIEIKCWPPINSTNLTIDEAKVFFCVVRLHLKFIRVYFIDETAIQKLR